MERNKEMQGSLLWRWMQFAKERFPLAEHGFMLGLFTLGNAAVAWSHYGQIPVGGWGDYCWLFLIVFMFFFRLRCFDEIKDYQVDLQHNPERPLARGLLTLAQTKGMIFALVIAELVLVLIFFQSDLWLYLIALVYSFLMFFEFFVGRLIRPHLTFYALTHTFVSSLVGLFIVFAASGPEGQQVQQVQEGLWVFALANWALFNLFEFARKTYAPHEERAGVDTYSSLFGAAGASMLSLAQVGCGLLVLAFMADHLLAFQWAQYVLALMPLLFGVSYAYRPTKFAKMFRTAVSAYLILFYALISVQALVGL